MISKKILVIFLFITIIFSVIFLACDNTMIEKQNSNFSVKIPIAPLYNNSNSFTNLTYNISAWLETENTILQTKTQKIMAEETSAILEFDNIFVGQKVRVRIEITQDELETPKYTGLSDWFIVKMGKNNVKINIKGDFSQPEQPTTYTVTFNSQGGSAVEAQTVKAGGTITAPENPTLNGYYFEYWCTDSYCQNEFKIDTPITEDITLYAKWRDANQVAPVTFKPDTENVDKNTLVTLSCETENATIYYNFENKEFRENTWQNDGWKPYLDDTTEGITIFEEAEGTTRTLYAIAICDGMENSDITSKIYSLTEYTIIFNTNCGTPIGNLEVLSGENISLGNYSEEITITGYEFSGWYLDAGCSGNAITELTFSQDMSGLNKENNVVTLYAKWTPITYTITYYLNAEGDTTEPENPNNITEYTIESETVVLQNPTREGYVFTGWYTDSNYGKKITQIEQGSTGDITLYAQWVQAQQVSSWVDLANTISENNNTGDASAPLVIQLKNSEDGSNGWQVNNSITISKPVTLIATEAITIKSNSSNLINFFVGDAELELRGLSHRETITLDAANSLNGSIIDSWANLSLKNCNLINNISSSAGGAINFIKLDGELLLENVIINNCSSNNFPSAVNVSKANSVNLTNVTISDTPNNSYCMYVAAGSVKNITFNNTIDMDKSIYISFNDGDTPPEIYMQNEFSLGENGLKFNCNDNYLSNLETAFESINSNYELDFDGTVSIKNQQSE